MSDSLYQVGQDIANLKLEVAVLRNQLEQALGVQQDAENKVTSKND